MDQGKDQLNARTGGGSQQVRANIDLTRQAMDRTIDAIEGKLTPGQMLLEGLNLLRSGGASGANKLVELAREHPVPAAVIGVGVGMMIRDVSTKKADGNRMPSGGYASGFGYGAPGAGPGYGPAYGPGYGPAYGAAGYGAPGMGGYKDKVGEAAHNAKDTVAHGVHEARDTVAEAAHTAKDAVAGAAQTARDSVSEAAHAARDTVSQAAQSAGEKVSSVMDSAREKASGIAQGARETVESVEERAARLRERARLQVRDAKIGFWQTLDQQPLVVGAAAIAIGLVAGLLVPSTRREDELMGERRDDLMQRAQERGREVLDKGKHVAQAAVQTVKAEAEQQGLSPSVLAEKVKTIGRDALDQAKTEAEREGFTKG
jgi:hypothetical protein